MSRTFQMLATVVLIGLVALALWFGAFRLLTVMGATSAQAGFFGFAISVVLFFLGVAVDDDHARG